MGWGWTGYRVSVTDRARGARASIRFGARLANLTAGTIIIAQVQSSAWAASAYVDRMSPMLFPSSVTVLDEAQPQRRILSDLQLLAADVADY